MGRMYEVGVHDINFQIYNDRGGLTTGIQQFPSGLQLSPSMISNCGRGFSCCHSAYALSSVCSNTGIAWAPDTAYLLLNTKNGTPCIPKYLAWSMSSFTSSA